MQAMPRVPDVASSRAISAGAMLVLCAGLALYQLTSLVLGPGGSRQLDLSLTIPAVEPQDLSEAPATTIKIVVGTRTTPTVSAPRVHTTPRAVPAPPATTSGQPLPTVVSGLELQAAGKKHHADH